MAERRNRRRVVIAVVGRSGVGKTTLLETLVPVLVRRGVAVGALKHASHGFLADRPGKDSHRLYESGAQAVAVISGEQIASFVRRRPAKARDASLDEALDALPDSLELVLAEGFSWEPVARIVLVRPGTEPLPEHRAAGEVLRQIEVPPPPPGEKPHFPRPLVEDLAATIVARLRDAESRELLNTGLRGGFANL